MESFEFNIHFLHGTIALLMSIVLLPMLLSTILSNTFAKQLQRNLLFLLSLNIVWDVLAFIEQLPSTYISETVRMNVYILGVLCWVQYGYAIFRVVSGLAGENLHPIWKKILPILTVWNFFGIIVCLISGFGGFFYSGIVIKWYGYTATNTLIANLCILLFLILPVTCAAIIAYQSMKSNAQHIYLTVFSVFVTSMVAGFLMDAVFPSFGLFIYAESAAIFLFIITATLYRANIALAQTEIDLPKILNHIVQDLEDGILILNSSGTVELANRAVYRMFGVGSRVILQKPISQFLPEIVPLAEMHNIPIVIRTTKISTSASVTPIYASNIRIGYKIVLDDLRKNLALKQQNSHLERNFQDSLNSINARYHNLQTLNRKQSLFLKSLLDYLPTRLWSKELVGTYSQQNQKDIDIRGMKLSQIDSPAFSDQERQAMESPGRVVIKNETSIDETGKKHWEKQTFIPMYDEAMRVNGVLGLIEDTTDFHALEEERNLLKENLLKASTFEDMSNVAGGLAHDFNNILTGVIGYRDLAEATLPKLPETERTSQYLLKMQKSLGNATELVKRTYDQLREKDGRREQKPEDFNVELVFDEVKDTLTATLPSNVQIVKDIEENIFAYGFQTDFHRIMLNMGKNAILAMEAGGTLTYGCRKIVLEKELVTHFATIPAGQYLFVTVKDTGEGMSQDVIDHIFTPYYTTREQGKGMGIGLAVAMRLIKSAHAYVSIDTKIGKGTTFELYWPMAKKGRSK